MKIAFKACLAAVCITAITATAASAAAPTWVQQSNQNAEVLLNLMARFNPEAAASTGVEGHDQEIIDLKPGIYERSQKAALEAGEELSKRLATTSDPLVKQDLEILIASNQDNYDSARINHDQMLPYFSVAQLMFGGIKALLDPRVVKERQGAAAVRLRRYTGLEAGYTPVTELAMALTRERLADTKLVGPYKGEVEQDLSDTATYIDGIRKLFQEYGLQGNDEALAAMETQLKAYDAWVRAEILPRARADNRLPPAIYADNLKQFGVRVEPQELIRRALLSYAEIRNEMQALAPLVAKARGYKATDYREVIAELKKQQVSGKAILPLYSKTLASIEDEIRREHIVSLPARAAKIRLASEAESAQIPAPHMNPPRLVGNTGEYGEFVLPLNVPAAEGRKALKTDDFTFEAATWTLTAHEARPGHELQFATMIERGVSTARAVFAFNSVNVEGWALYSEAEMKPFFPLDGQLIGLQHRLMRAARAFLDPMLNLGLIQPDEARELLMKEVCLSPAMAKQEVDRYTFRSPGQATSYFVGYQALMETRERAELALKKRFDRQRFNDFVLGQGMLPPALLQRAVMETFVPEELAR
jgi:Bacterial protein of unknown function (DUF885)